MSQPVCSAASRVRRALLSVLSALFMLLAFGQPALAQRVMPDAAPLTNFSPLCDGTLVHCLEIDDFAGHVYGHLQVLPKTDRRDTAAVFPLGVTLGMFGRFAGGISTSYSFWKENDALYQQFGPVRLSLVGRLLPIFPLLSSGGGSAQEDDGATHYAPPRGLRLGLAYEHEVRVGPFSGANSLGLLTNIASLAVISSRMFGPLQLSASVGALYDWGGLFATGQVSAQAGLYLPFFRALKIFVEAMGRGFPAYVKKDTLLPGGIGSDPIHAQGLVGLESPETKKRELTDCLLERRGKEWVPVHRPRLDGSCRMTDSDGTVLGYVGVPTADGKRCRYSGERSKGSYGKYTATEERPVGELFYTDADRTAVCLDAAMRRCFMKPPVGRHTLAWGDDARATTALVGSFEGGLAEQAEDAKKVGKVAKEVVTGKVKVSTLYEEGKQAAENVLDGAAELATDPKKRAEAVNAARSTIDRIGQAIDDWGKKPPEEQLEDAASTTGRAGSFLATGAILNGSTRVVEEAVGAVGAAAESVKAGEALTGATVKERAMMPSPKALPSKPEPKGLLKGRPEPVNPPQAGRFIVDNKGMC